MESKNKDDFKLFGDTLKVTKLIEPDEILWENFPYDFTAQLIRRLTLILLSLIFFTIITVLTIYIVVG